MTPPSFETRSSSAPQDEGFWQHVQLAKKPSS
jgi:hypothetical protein